MRYHLSKHCEDRMTERLGFKNRALHKRFIERMETEGVFLPSYTGMVIPEEEGTEYLEWRQFVVVLRDKLYITFFVNWSTKPPKSRLKSKGKTNDTKR